MADWIASTNSESTEQSIAELVAQTAAQVVSEHEQQQMVLPEDYQFYEEYGAYYSYESGYFYDPNSSLFFHPATQCYYSYNEQSGQYEVFYPSAEEKATTDETATIKWTKRNFKKRAESLLGPTFVESAVQEDVDVLELTLDLVDRCSFLAGDYCSKQAQKRARLEERMAAADSDDYEHFGGGKSGPFKHPHKDDYLSSSSEEGMVEEAETNFWLNHELERRMIEEEIAANAPCIRLIELPAARLHIVTIFGAKIGTGAGMDVQLDLPPTIDTSSREEEPFFTISYLAAANEESEESTEKGGGGGGGYWLQQNEEQQRKDVQLEVNGQRIEPSSAQQYPLRHEDQIRLVDYYGDSNCIVNFTVHIHSGLNTCQGCEPGLFAQSSTEQQKKLGKFSKHAERRRQNRALKEQYGLIDEVVDLTERRELRAKYMDRAKHRRAMVGSEHPALLMEKQKTTAANPAGGIYSQCAVGPVPGCSTDSVQLRAASSSFASSSKAPEAAIEENNKGFRLLTGMGWQSGQGLGKNNQGIQAPIQSLVKNDRVGLGASTTDGKTKISIKLSDRQELLELTRRRYDEIQQQQEDGAKK